MTADENSRTRQYTGGRVSSTPVTLVIGDAVAVAGGQAALLGAANALIRNHPVVYVVAPEADSVLAPAAGISDLLGPIGAATSNSRLEVVRRPPAGSLVIGVGPDVEANLYLGADRFTGYTASSPVTISSASSSMYGGALAAMLGASRAFRTTVGMPLSAHRGASIWTLQETMHGSGPETLAALDLSGTWLVGAGGVGCSAAWWMNLFGCTGTGVVIDHDCADITNLNRTLGMFFGSSGLADGAPRMKAEIAAALIGARPFNGTWDDWMGTNPPVPDVIIPAANELGVRAAISSYSHPMALTGTTSRNWTAELHLYRAGMDSCPSCRHPEGGAAPAFECGTSAVAAEGNESQDAALSFLSGAAGLLTVAGLALAQAAQLPRSLNMWSIDFAEAHRGVLRPKVAACTTTCRRTLSQALRSRTFGETRFFA